LVWVVAADAAQSSSASNTRRNTSSPLNDRHDRMSTSTTARFNELPVTGRCASSAALAAETLVEVFTPKPAERFINRSFAGRQRTRR
jgi:hypothetical protein